MRRKKTFTFIGVTICFALISFWGIFSLSGSNQTSLDLPFKVYVKEEKRSDSGIAPQWKVSVILDKEVYSKDNLEILFGYYLKKYPNKQQYLQVKVYTSLENYEQEFDPEFEESFGLPSKQTYFNPNTRLVHYDAIFYRQGDGAIAKGGDNEWYSYSPDLSSPNQSKIIILKGTLRFQAKKIIETWESTSNNIKLKVTKYEMKDVEPSGTYYTFESFTNNYNAWQSILTFRHNKDIPIPKEQIRVMNAQLAYFYIGWMFAITKDGGGTWIIWDAKTDMPEWECCSYELIQNVRIDLDGSGTLKLNKGSGEQRVLHTNDFGKHWSLE